MDIADRLSQGLARLGGVLPAGQLVTPFEASRPAYWLSDAAPPPALWASLREAHPSSGLWPLLLMGLYSETNRPWVDGETDDPDSLSVPADHDAEELLSGWWTDEDGEVRPFGQQWPGLAEPGVPRVTPERAADELARDIAADPECLALNLRLGLVAVDRGADALTATGWTGPLNHTNDTAEISAVVRSWEERFGVRVVAVGFDTLHLSVAAPPTTKSHAQRVAAEHLAFCPDNIWQGTEDLREYARLLESAPSWSFWWD